MFGARAIKRRRDKEAEIKALKANGPPPAFVRTGPSGVKGGAPKNAKNKGKKGGKGKKEMYELIVNIDLSKWRLSDEQVAEYKEVFMLFDRDEDGVLSFQELQVVMKSLGQRPTEEELLTAVREVSEDYLYDTVEFNEFLQLMSKQQDRVFTTDALSEAFRMFDDDDDGYLTVSELTEVVTAFGDKLNHTELNNLILQGRHLTNDEDCPTYSHEESINYEALAEYLADNPSDGATKPSTADKTNEPASKPSEGGLKNSEDEEEKSDGLGSPVSAGKPDKSTAEEAE